VCRRCRRRVAELEELLAQLTAERDSLERVLEAERSKVWVPVREMPGHVIRAIQ
jgi:chorismate-pyruvate lyase